MRPKYVCRLGIALLSVGLVSMLQAADLTEKQLRQKLAQSLPQVEIEEIQRLNSPSMFRVITKDWQELYVSLDGRRFILGEQFIFDASGRPKNISRLERQRKQFELASQLPRNQTIVFPAKGKTKAWVLVFTDIDCGYCRKFHREIDQVNALGIEVRYAAFPRTGPNTASFSKAENVWCAPDQQKAMTLAKQGRPVSSKACANPVAAQYNFGNRVGVRGTPTMFLSNGKVVPGYVPSTRLAEALAI